LNAKIFVTQIQARAWELLIAMLVMESIFGIAGVVAAPIFYAYMKQELINRHLV
jgi:predicted PurR-regulated permease PerM